MPQLLIKDYRYSTVVRGKTRLEIETFQQDFNSISNEEKEGGKKHAPTGLK